MKRSTWPPPGPCCNWSEVGGRSDAMLRVDLDLDLERQHRLEAELLRNQVS